MDDQPSTSKEPYSGPSTEQAKTQLISEEEIQQDALRLDNRLEEAAKHYNLTTLNVKNIIFHIIKDPHTLAALLDGDENAIESLKLTRSRLRELEKAAKTKLNIELKPVSAKSTRPTLLDFDFDDDEDDSDYMPPPDEMQDQDKYEFEDFTEEELAAEGNTEYFFGHDVRDQIQSSYMDPDYAKFVESCANPSIVEDTWLEENDEDYNVLPDEEYLDMDEFRNDRSTKISKRELRHLYNDIIPNDLLLDEEPPIKKPKAKRRLSFGANLDTPNLNTPSTSHTTQTNNEIYDDLQQFYSEIDPNSANSSNSWSLLRANRGEIARFKEEEILCLKVQMEKHVQLLTQHIVSTTGIQTLIPTRNCAIRMIHELDEKMYGTSQHSIFQISTLPEAVVSCHEIESFDVEKYVELVGENAEANFPDGNLQYKASIVLAKSLALLYPELLPTIQPCLHSNPLSNFIAAEQMLLVLALFELHHVKHSTGGIGRINVSKYQTISTYFIPNKTPNQIRNHLKNIRAGNLTSPLHQLIVHAERGKFNATVELDNGSTKLVGPPIDWPSNITIPRWLQSIQNLRISHQNVKLPQHMENVQNYITPQIPIVQLPPNYSVIQIYDGQIQLMPSSTVSSPFVVLNANSSTSSVAINTGIPNSPFQPYTLTTTIENETEVIAIDKENQVEQKDAPSEVSTPIEQKKSKKVDKMRQRCVESFDNPEVVEMWSSLVLQTVYNLVKQRLFMHDGKFKTFLSVLSNSKKSSADKYDELAKLLRDTQPELADCIAALMDDEELRPDQEQNPERCAYKSALEMLMNIHIYFNGQQNKNMKRRLLRLIRDLCFTEQSLREEMQKLLSGRHEPLWKRLRQHFRGEHYREKVDMSRGEEISLSHFNSFSKDLSGKNCAEKVNLCAEFVDLTTPNNQTQKMDSEFTPDLRLQNGYFMFRLPNGQSVPVNILSPSKVTRTESDTQKKLIAPVVGSIFAPEHDRELLYGYNSSKANLAKAVEKFVRDQQNKYPDNQCPFNEENTQKRLKFLLELLSCMTTT